jgi:hypothetical protein
VTTTFKAGDKVSFHQEDNVHWQGGHGIITAVHPGTHGTTKYDVEIVEAPLRNTVYRKGNTIRGIDNYSGWMTLVETSFTFADIQVGDTIRRTRTYVDGSTAIREGVVANRGSYYWENKDSTLILAQEDDTDNQQVTLELLNRPEPEPVKPTLLENSQIGDRISVTDNRGVVKLYTKTHKDSWKTLVYPKHSAQPHNGFTWGTAHVELEAAREGAAYTLLPA